MLRLFRDKDKEKDPSTLYRAVSLPELEKIVDLEARAFPAAGADLPLALTEDHAREDAQGWNLVKPECGYAGFATVFNVDPQYIKQFPEEGEGGHRREIRIPAGEIENFNRHLQGRIKVVKAYFGALYKGPEAAGPFAGLGPRQQFLKLVELLGSGMASADPLLREHGKLVAINLLYWREQDYTRDVPDRLRIALTKAAVEESFQRTPWLELHYYGGFGG